MSFYDLKSGDKDSTRSLAGERVVFCEDGRTLLAASARGASLHEVTTGKARWNRPLARGENGFGLGLGGMANDLCLAALDRAGKRAVLVRAQDLSVLDAVSGRLVNQFALEWRQQQFGGWSGGRSAALSGSGRWLAVMGEHQDEVRLFDLDGKEPDVAVLKRKLLPASNTTGCALDFGGSRLITCHDDGTCLVWDVKKLLPPAKEAPDLWELLARPDAAEAQPAIVALTEDGPRAVKLFSQKLEPAVEVPAARIAAWVADLGSEDFDRRSDAERRLADAGDQAEDALRKAVLEPASAEQKRRAERLLGRIDPKNAPHLRHLRAVEVLERLGTKGAIELLQKLARGAPAARLTREATESLRRLKRSEEP